MTLMLFKFNNYTVGGTALAPEKKNEKEGRKWRGTFTLSVNYCVFSGFLFAALDIR